MGDMPLMTDNGTFVVNGTERVIVSQMHRSPGVFFDHDRGKTHSSGKFLYSARIIPYRGSWLDFEFDAKDLVHVRIDRRRKLPVTTLLLALGPGPGDDPQHLLQRDLLPPRRPGLADRVPPRAAARPEAHRRPGRRRHRPDAGRGRHQADAAPAQEARGAGHAARSTTPPRSWSAATSSRDLINEETGLVLRRGRRRADRRDASRKLGEAGIDEMPVLDIDHLTVGPYIRNTLALDRCQNREEALLDIYRVLRPGEPPTLDTAEALFHGLIFDSERYDLSPVGRVKMNMRLGLETEDTLRVLRDGGHRRRRPDAGRDQGRPRRDRRHRSPRQPARALGRRADGEPVPRRPAAHGARGARADELGRDRRGDAARPDQRQAGGGGGARVLRQLAAVAVHGPDQPAVGDHPQAAPVGAGPGRPDPRAGGLRGARRAPDPLRPDLPDRDARKARTSA